MWGQGCGKETEGSIRGCDLPRDTAGRGAANAVYGGLGAGAFFDLYAGGTSVPRIVLIGLVVVLRSRFTGVFEDEDEG